MCVKIWGLYSKTFIVIFSSYLINKSHSIVRLSHISDKTDYDLTMFKVALEHSSSL